MRLPLLLWRQFAAAPLGRLVVALLVAALTALVVAGPKVSGNLDDAQLAHRLGGLSALQGDVTTSWSTNPSGPGIAGHSNPWEPLWAAAAEIRRSQPEPLRTILQQAQFKATTSKVYSLTPPPESGYYLVSLDTAVDPHLTEHAQLVAGSWPQPPPPVNAEADAEVEVTVLESVAEALGWDVGQQIPDGARVVGIHRPTDPEDPRWQHLPAGASYAELVNPDRGVELAATLFLSPLSNGNLVDGVPEPVRVEMWFGIDAGLATGVDVATLRTQLTGLLARSYPMAARQADGQLGTLDVELRSDLRSALDEVASQQRTANTLLLVLAAGPVAMALVLVGLGVRLVTHRRTPTLELLHARGASLRQLRLGAAIEGGLLSVPAAVAGHLAGAWLVPGPQDWWAWVPTALIAVVAAAALALGAGAIRERGSRADLGPRSGRLRITAELLLAAVAAAATWRLATLPDRAAAEQAGGADLLATAAPVLVALAVCLLALRLYPPPLRALLAVLRRGRGLVGFLGAARALRSPAGGSTPMFAVVLGTTVAVLSTVVLGTVHTGTERAGWSGNGADVNVSGPPITDAVLTDLEGIDGVEAVARLIDTRERRRLQADGEEAAVTVWVAEPGLAGVYATAGLPPLPAGFFAGGATPTIVTGGAAPSAATAELAGLGPVEVGAHWEVMPGSPAGGAWVLLSAERWAATGSPAVLSRLALVDVAEDHDASVVAASIAELVGAALVTTAQDQVRAAQAQPVVSNLGALLWAISGITVSAMAAAVMVAQGMGNRERAHVSGVLRVLGARPGTIVALAAWELLPVVVTALLVGVALGIGIAALLLAALDFTGLTGGLSAPALAISWPLLGAVLLTVVAVTTLAVMASSWFARRSDTAVGTLTGEDS